MNHLTCVLKRRHTVTTTPCSYSRFATENIYFIVLFRYDTVISGSTLI